MSIGELVWLLFNFTANIAAQNFKIKPVQSRFLRWNKEEQKHVSLKCSFNIALIQIYVSIDDILIENVTTFRRHAPYFDPNFTNINAITMKSNITEVSDQIQIYNNCFL